MDPEDLKDIQGIVLHGYGDLRAARFLLFAVRDPARAKQWMTSVARRITDSRTRPSGPSVNVAFTYEGLRSVGTPASELRRFSREFREGMAFGDRQRMLGDIGPSAPSTWEWGGPTNSPVHVLLLVYAPDERALGPHLASEMSACDEGGLMLVRDLETVRLEGRKEVFGFRDGISQPEIKELGASKPSNGVAAGEFLLGHVNEYGEIARGPETVGRNGSYLVMRQLQQDVHRFWSFVDESTRRPDGTSDPDARLRLAAKMVGRWPGGAPLTLSPDRDDPALADANEFEFQDLDPHGLRCPIGSHVRRSNPRDTLEPNPGSRDSIKAANAHRMIRRGRAYGPEAQALTPAEALAEPAGVERGLHFICFNANIARQFEFVQASWIDNPKFQGLYDDPDPLMGAGRSQTAAARACFVEQAVPVRRRVTGLPFFVTVRGGEYFFLPSISAIAAIGAGGP